MTTELYPEDVERIRTGVDPINFLAALTRVRYLFSKAEPGNWAYRELESRWGFEGDYRVGDHGDPPESREEL